MIFKRFIQNLRLNGQKGTEHSRRIRSTIDLQRTYGGGVAPVGMNGEQLLRQESRALNVLSVLIEQFLGDTMI